MNPQHVLLPPWVAVLAHRYHLAACSHREVAHHVRRRFGIAEARYCLPLNPERKRLADELRNTLRYAPPSHRARASFIHVFRHGIPAHLLARTA